MHMWETKNHLNTNGGYNNKGYTSEGCGVRGFFSVWFAYLLPMVGRWKNCLKYEWKKNEKSNRRPLEPQAMMVTTTPQPSSLSSHYHLWQKKTWMPKKDDFKQQTACEALICWSKYTTFMVKDIVKTVWKNVVMAE